jgi:hypothetical protein
LNILERSIAPEAALALEDLQELLQGRFELSGQDLVGAQVVSGLQVCGVCRHAAFQRLPLGRLGGDAGERQLRLQGLDLGLLACLAL